MQRARRRIVLLGAMLAAAPRVGGAQAPPRPLRLAALSESTEAARRANWKQFTDRLAELGYVSGRNLAIEARFAEDVPSRLPGLASELVAWKPDVVVAMSTTGAIAAKAATASIPIVFIGPADPVGSGLVTNLGRPDGNVTGLSPMQSEIGAKWIELLREIVPGLQRAAYLTDAGNPGEMLVAQQIQARATALGATVRVFDGVQPGAIDRAFAAIAAERPDGIIVGLTAALLPHRDRIVRFAADGRRPSVYARREYPVAGGLLSYGADPGPLYRRAADYVSRIAGGAKPADLPVERPNLVKLVVNQRAAREQGIAIPRSILVAADEVLDR